VVRGLYPVDGGGDGPARRARADRAPRSSAPSPTAPTSSSSPTATPPTSWPRSRRCCSPRGAPPPGAEKTAHRRSASWSRPATPARCTTWRCSSATARRRSTRTWPSRPSRNMARAALPGVEPEKAVKNYIKALGKGVLKVMSRWASPRSPPTRAPRSSRPSAWPGPRRPSTSPAPPRSSGASASTSSPRRSPSPRARLPPQRRRAGPPRARGRRRVPVASRGRVPPVQPRDRLQAAARHPHRRYEVFKEYTAASTTRRAPGHPARPVRSTGRARAGAHRRGRAGQRDRQAVLHRRHELRLDLGRRPTRPWPSP
jgi:hypothetical protein